MNFLNSFIECICNNGNVRVKDIEGNVVDFSVNGRDIIVTYCSNELPLFPTKPSYKKVLSLMAAIVIQSVDSCFDYIISSTLTFNSSYDNLFAANKLYDIFSTMLFDDSVYHEQLLGDDCLNIMANYAESKTLFRSNPMSLDEIKASLSTKHKKFSAERKRALCKNNKFKESNGDSISLDTSLLDDLNLVYEFVDERDFVINPAIGREKEIRQLGSVLLTPSYSALIVGPSGVGKTAIIEGLVYAIKNNQTSDELKNLKILKISPTSIISGCSLVGQFEKKMEAIVEFLKNNPNVILYMDELHSVINKNAGGTQPVDIVNFLKTYLENGSITMIGATTIDEYNDYLKRDSAFTRRFKLITVDEPDKKTLKDIINRSIDKYEKVTGISFETDIEKKEAMIDELLILTDEFWRKKEDKRYNPALVLKVIESAFGYARYDKRTSVGVDSLSEAIENCSDIVDEIKERVSLKIRSLDNVPTDGTNLSFYSKTKRRRFNPNHNINPNS